MQSKRLIKNTYTSIIYQVATLICGFVLPRLILGNFGSEVNGLVNSITQFLQVIQFLELGVGAVVRTSLYKPLADRNNSAISEIITSANRFFRKLAIILLCYVGILLIVYPYVSNSSFDHKYTALLIMCMAISSFAQYYFGITDILLLTADQKVYIQYNVQTVTMIANILMMIVLINIGASIHAVKLATSILYLVRPLVIRIYVNRHYCVCRKVKLNREPIEQKWNGAAQHIVSVVLESTDSVVLTLFSTLSNVSIYGVYQLVVVGVRQFFLLVSSGIQSFLGELWAKGEREKLNNAFGWVEWGVHTATVLVYGCTAVLIIPFVQVYTLGVHDADYTQPLFAAILTLAYALYCMRLPYNIMILVCGHYKQTQSCYIIAAIINVVISVATVMAWGLIGVAIGTAVSMLYQIIWMCKYDSKNLFEWPIKNVIKQVFVDILTVVVAILVTRGITIGNLSYSSWILMAVKVFVCWLITVLIVNSIFYNHKICRIKNKFLSFSKIKR